MICPTCTSKTLALFEDKTCSSCRGLVKKPPVRKTRSHNSQRKTRLATIPVKATGKRFGKVSYYPSVNAAAEHYRISPKTIEKIINGHLNGGYTGWTFEFVSDEEYEKKGEVSGR